MQVLESGAGITARADSGVVPERMLDLADVAGQPAARLAAEICAAGGHHLLLLGRPGVVTPMPGMRH